jgi:catechol 2,3-dioxygenase-like lactoylglutathione lyase family enzyme
MTENGRIYPRALNHVGLAVQDIDAAVDWYGRVLGFELFAGPLEMTSEDEVIGPILQDVLPGVRRVKQAHLAMGGGVGLELFQFIEPPADLSKNDALPPLTGFFHVCVSDPDPASLAARIAANGGRQRSKVYPYPGSTRYLFVYAEDPWRNLIEIYSHDYQRTNINRA